MESSLHQMNVQYPDLPGKIDQTYNPGNLSVGAIAIMKEFIINEK